MPAPDHRPVVVLVTEDEALVRPVATDVLSDDGYRVIDGALPRKLWRWWICGTM